MKLNQILCVIGFALTVSLPVEGGKSYDPSTIINVYPSLEHLKDDVPPPEGDCEDDDALCSAASNPKPVWSKSEELASPKPGNADAPRKLEKMPEQKPAAQSKASPEDGRQRGMYEYGASTESNKPRNWSSFQDMLQLLRKKKH